MEPTHDEIRDLLPAFALGAVADDEAASVRAHIRTCDACAHEAAMFAETSARLASSTHGEAVPDGFADRVLAAATAGRTEIARPRRRRSLMPVLAAAAVVLIAAVVAFQVVELRADRDRREQVLAVLARDAGIELAGGGGAEAAVVPNGVGSLFAVSGLERAPSGKTYQLWLMDGDRPISAGTFSVEDGIALVEVAQPVEDYDGAAVTIEKAGGAVAPTTEPVLSG